MTDELERKYGREHTSVLMRAFEAEYHAGYRSVLRRLLRKESFLAMFAHNSVLQPVSQDVNRIFLLATVEPQSRTELTRLIYGFYEACTVLAALKSEQPVVPSLWATRVDHERFFQVGTTRSFYEPEQWQPYKGVFVEGTEPGKRIHLELRQRREDASGHHAAVGMELIFAVNSYEEVWMTPSLSAFRVLSKEWTQEVLHGVALPGWWHIVLEVTFVPQLFPELLEPSEEIWDELRSHTAAKLEKWLASNPVANLEQVHRTYGCTMLYSAARYGNLAAAKALVRRCAHVDSTLSQRRSTALHAAVFFGHPDVVNLLLEHRASILTNEFGLTPFQELMDHTPQEVQRLCRPCFDANPWAKEAAPPPVEEASGSKFSARYLVFGARVDFLKNIEDYIGPPPHDLMAALAREFSRDIRWTDKHATPPNTPGFYGATSEFDKATRGVADPTIRDHARRLGLGESHTLALRLYTLAPYKVLNEFIRKVCMATAEQRRELLRPETTWAGFAWAVYLAFSQLAEQEAEFPTVPEVFRGADMSLPPEFFIPDERGMVSAMEYAFASTSQDEEVARDFASGATGGAGVVFHIRCCQRDALGFHAGVSLRWVSAVPDEEEFLFPPFTLFKVLSMRRELHSITLEVCPTWLPRDMV